MTVHLKEQSLCSQRLSKLRQCSEKEEYLTQYFTQYFQNKKKLRDSFMAQRPLEGCLLGIELPINSRNY